MRIFSVYVNKLNFYNLMPFTTEILNEIFTWLLDIVIICSTDSVKFYLWWNIPTYLPTQLSFGLEMKRIEESMGNP